MSKSDQTGIAVIESKWWPKSNVSVQGLFDLISDIYCENHHGFHYETATSHDSMKEIIPRVGSYRHCRILYIGCHGDPRGLEISDNSKQLFTAAKLANALNGVRASRLDGLHLGCCNFGTETNASTIFKSGAKVKWISGYTEKVDWLYSSAFDLMFFNALLDEERRRGPKLSEDRQIRKIASELNARASGLIKELGFCIYTRKKGGGIVNLIEKLNQPE